LEDKDHPVKIRHLTSGLHGIEIMPDGTLVGGADPRREGIALGG
jgi:gamma-glutamyltranspeptidase/glutathione hydrolase